MSKPVIDLVTRTDPAGHALAWACGKCRYVHVERDLADRCCLCTDCGFFSPHEGAIGSRCVSCQDALGAKRVAHEIERLAAAPSVTEIAHGEAWLYVESGDGPGDGYFPSADALRDWYTAHDLPCPARAWACEKRALTLDALEILQREVDSFELHDGAMDHLGDEGARLLQCLLDAWLATYAKEIASWFPTDTAVVLETRDRLRPPVPNAASGRDEGDGH